MDLKNFYYKKNNCFFYISKFLVYNVQKFDGKKYFVLSTANAFGGKNDFLAIAYLVVGGLCFLITFLFIIKKAIHKDSKKSN